MRKSNVEYEFLSLLGKFITEYLPVSMNASPNTILSYKCAFRLLQFLPDCFGTHSQPQDFCTVRIPQKRTMPPYAVLP